MSMNIPCISVTIDVQTAGHAARVSTSAGAGERVKTRPYSGRERRSLSVYSTRLLRTSARLRPWTVDAAAAVKMIEVRRMLETMRRSGVSLCGSCFFPVVMSGDWRGRRLSGIRHWRSPMILIDNC